MDVAYDIRTRTTLVCGALALAIAFSSLLRSAKVRRTNLLFAAFAADVGLWYLSQSLFGFFQAPIWERLRVVLAVFLPVFAVNLFESMVPAEDALRRYARFGRLSLVVVVPVLVLALSPYLEYAVARITIFLYAVTLVAAGLYELGQRGRHSRSRATQRRVQFLVVIGALAGVFTVADFAWVIGYAPAYDPPPVGVVLSIVFLFVLAQAVRQERLLDLYEMLGRLVVATAVAFLIAGIFYLLVTVVGQFNTMWLNAILVAIMVLVLFNPLRDWVEEQIQRFVFRERRRLERVLANAQRRLMHTLEVEELGEVVMRALERSRSVTTAAIYLMVDDGTVFEQLASLGPNPPPRIDVASANALLDQLSQGTVVLEQIARDVQQGRPAPGRYIPPELVLAAAVVLGPARKHAVVLGIRGEEGELVGLLVVADDRIGDAFSPEDISLLEGLAAQIGVVIESTRVYAKMKERDRLAVLGQMAAGLAHEIRNPLGAIKGAAQLLADPGPDGSALDEPAREFLGIILEEVDRLDGVVGSVLDLARQNTDVVAPIDINAVVRRTLQVMTAEWSETELQLETEFDEDLPRAAIVPEQLRQVLMNLLRNAMQATKGSGRVVVRSRTRRRGDDSHIVISVIDDGPGIAPVALKDIFLPFYTTKEEGTGLGLAICQRIVQGVGGRIEVRSRVQEGTCFDLVLPAAMDALGTPMPAPTGSDRSGRQSGDNLLDAAAPTPADADG